MQTTKKKPRYIWCPFKEARAFVHSLGLNGFEDWVMWAKSDTRPNDIPAGPYRVYKNKGWVSFGDWVGTGRVAYQNMSYRPFTKSCE